MNASRPTLRLVPAPETFGRTHPGHHGTGRCEMTRQVLEAMEDASRRMEDLARELGCLGYFNDDNDRPRAA